ncbi:hypothetical protein EPA93_35030 [Ktedonosporobacter rubrisoli]|uniref:Uncharacterized protein n=1 Tax=Ktedonosporobacter rubrisoli TaxID=2509675 RepID=A0A4P6JZ85_KTERU|nr:hypothetical protein [Ktedonosporobacter rubrisoli]QBD80905.1 hypothetical protein EPA93_35030 [Ktedonosporobacter rubrisoli]
MDQSFQSHEQVEEHKPLSPHYEVFADGKLFYDGYNRKDSWWAFVRAGKSGARRVCRFADGVMVTASWPVGTSFF